MKGIICIDTMHLSVKYPKVDVFTEWYRYVANIDHRKLKEGIPVGDYVVKGGASCYKVSVWQHDARAYLTNYVDEIVGEGKGSGIWLQLGPKFLIQHINNLQAAVWEFLKGIGVEKTNFPVRITRVDLAIDLFNVDMKNQDLNSWVAGWVGRSKVSSSFMNSRTGDLETITIGSRGSSVYLRIYNKVAQAAKEGDIDYWWDVWKNFSGPVTRVEWEIKPCEGNFSDDLKDFSIFTGFSIRELLIYLLDWGRLCIPDPSDSNNRRWKEAEFWVNLRSTIELWLNGIDWPTSRYGKEFHGISEGYIKFLSGTVAGGMARFGEQSPDAMALFEGLNKHGETFEKIKEKAIKKAAIYSRL